MPLVRVLWRNPARGAALGGDGVAAHRVDLGDHSRLDPWIGLDRSYRCPDSGEAPADDQDVIALKVHLPSDSIWSHDRAVLGPAARKVPWTAARQVSRARARRRHRCHERALAALATP